MIEHPQVPFLTLDKRLVTVDEGLLDILEALRDLGIRTEYSCESDFGQAYVVMTGLSYRRFNKMLGRSKLNSKFRGGRRVWEFALFAQQGTNKFFDISMRRKGPYYGFKVTHEWTNQWGFRTTYRWPTNYTHELRQLLKEMRVPS